MNPISYPVTPQQAGFGEAPLPFSVATQFGNLLFVSGQASVDENGAIISGTFEEEFRRSMDFVRRILEAAGSDFSRVVQVRAYVRDAANVPLYNQLYREYFSHPLLFFAPAARAHHADQLPARHAALRNRLHRRRADNTMTTQNLNSTTTSPNEQHTESAKIFAFNNRYIPGGTVSLNRRVEPLIAFVRGEGAWMWDADGTRYLDYHAAFAPYLLGHSNPEIEAAVADAMAHGWTLTGTGTTPWEGRAAQLLVESVASLEKVQFTTTGSESTYHALRLARTFTGRDHIVVMQGGYNGWHDEVACNVMTPLEQIGPRVEKGGYPFVPLSAGMPSGVAERVHVINFNDLDSLEWAFQTYDVACLLSEPILQNIGVVKPLPGYLEGVRELCDRYGVIWAMDEVKTGFRHALGGFQSIAGVTPDLSIFGKAIANGHALGAIGGRADLMALFDAPDPAQRVLIAGTYNGHPVPIAAIATMEKLSSEGEAIYAHLEALGAQMQAGLQELFDHHEITATVVRQGSAFCVYFMDHAPRDWHDLAQNHDMKRDTAFRRALIARGIYLFPLPTKQGSISAAHTSENIEATLQATKEVLHNGF